MKRIEVTMVITVPEDTDEKLLVGSIVDDAIRAYQNIDEIEYDWRERSV
jgi:hypothetical protein